MEVFRANSRLEDREAVAAELDEIKPTHVLNAAGITGRPNIDWCETHKPETIRTNVIGTLNLADLCYIRDIHCTVYATGCIFVYDEKHPLGSGIGFTEEDTPNFDGSFYSQTKGYMEPMLKEFPNCLILRVRMPISDDLIHRSFVTKIVKYERVVNIPNSMTILTEMLPASLVRLFNPQSTVGMLSAESISFHSCRLIFVFFSGFILGHGQGWFDRRIQLYQPWRYFPQ